MLTLLRRLLAPVVLVLAAGVALPGATATAARTSYDSQGTILVDGVKTFPIALLRPPPLGSTTPWGTDALDAVVGAGVNLLASGPFGANWTDAALADVETWSSAATARRVHTWVNLRELARAQPGTPEDAMLQNVVTSFKDNSGVAMWKGADEPWWNGWPVSSLQYAYAVTKSIDPGRLSLVIQAPRGSPYDLQPYTAVADVHSVDVYPVAYGIADPDLHAVGAWTRALRSITPSRAVFTTLQICFSGSDDPSGSGAYVLPTREQQRYMIYDAILNGARGLVFFGGGSAVCLGARDAALGWNWTFWSTVLAPLIREIGPRSKLYPALLNAGTGPRVRAADPTTQVASRRVGRRTIWVIAARSGRGAAKVKISGLPRWLERGDVYKEGRSVRVRNGAFTDRFSRWAVHVYRFRS